MNKMIRSTFRIQDIQFMSNVTDSAYNTDNNAKREIVNFDRYALLISINVYCDHRRMAWYTNKDSTTAALATVTSMQKQLKSASIELGWTDDDDNSDGDLNSGLGASCCDRSSSWLYNWSSAV